MALEAAKRQLEGLQAENQLALSAHAEEVAALQRALADGPLTIAGMAERIEVLEGERGVMLCALLHRATVASKSDDGRQGNDSPSPNLSPSPALSPNPNPSPNTAPSLSVPPSLGEDCQSALRILDEALLRAWRDKRGTLEQMQSLGAVKDSLG